MAPEISVVIPCLNEEEAVGAVVDQAWEGIERSGRTGEVIVVDNASTDRSAEVAAEHGATVVREERPGYGSAYLAGLDARPRRLPRDGRRGRDVPDARSSRRSSTASPPATTS